MKRLLLALPLLACLASPLASALDVGQAYAAIPHRRTPYDASTSPSAAAQKASLARLFHHTDRGVVLRVEGMQAHAAKDAAAVKRVMAQYDALIGDLEKAELAAEVAPARPLIVEALRVQQRHFQSKPVGALLFGRSELHADPAVKDAHSKLLKAYRGLMSSFPGETPRNRTSFFDHLCALDFL